MVVEKSEVYKNIFPKTKMRQEMRRGVRWAGPGGLLFPAASSHPPSSKDQFLD